ncbi:lipopolysaccharide biosynthesis protein [Ralstonia solanacearum]|nr:oligosaccharide flippase family protein [Ralstonia solanacearum]
MSRPALPRERKADTVHKAATLSAPACAPIQVSNQGAAMSTALAPEPTPTAAQTAPLRSDMAFVVGSKLLYLVTRLAMPPLVLSHVGLAEYGLWTTCFILVSYIGMSASGFSTVYVRYVAQYHARQDHQAISRLLSTGILTMGAVAALLLLTLWLTMPGLLVLFNVAAPARATASTLWLGACAIFLLDASVGAFGYVLHGLQRIRREQQIWIAAYLLEMACILLFLHLGLGVYGLLAAFGVRYAFSIAAAALVVRREIPELRLGPAWFDRRCLSIFFGFGTWVQLGGLLGTFLYSADRLLAGTLIGPAAAAVLDLAGKLPATGASLASSVSLVALPAASRQNALGAKDGLLNLYAEAVRATALLAALILPPLACLAPLVIAAWLGERADAASLATILSWVALGTHLHILTGPASSIFRGLGKVGNEYIYHGLRLAGIAIAVGFLLLGTPQRAPQPGALAVALGLGGLGAAALYLVVSHRQLRGGLTGFGRLYLLPFLLPYAVGAGTMLLADRWPLTTHAGRAEALAHLLLAALLYLFAAGALAWHLVLSPAERAACRRRLPGRAGRFSGECA